MTSDLPLRIALALGVSSVFLMSPAEHSPRPLPPGWPLVWHDEFDGPGLDTAKWTRKTGGDGWGNAYLEFYTDRGDNAPIEAGQLVIEARRQQAGGRDYTSARLKTRGAPGGAWQYGDRKSTRLNSSHGY